MHGSITIIGAGAVGISSAIHLQRRGWRVTLLDRGPPASETSWGNAGIINPASPVPLNNPDLHASLAGLLMNDKAALRYSPGHVLRQLPWMLEFLRASKTHAARRTAQAMFGLTNAALDEHRALMQRTGNGHRFHETGWIKAFRRGAGKGSGGAGGARLAGSSSSPSSTPPSRAARARGTFEFGMLAELGLEVRELDARALAELVPALSPIFDSALHLVGGGFVDSPGLLMREHAERFVADGGEFREADVIAIERGAERLAYRTPDALVPVERVLVAAGPWSAELLAGAGYSIPLGVERGYHAHFRLADGVALDHPVQDVDAAYNMTPMVHGLRITTGVELAARDAASNLAQLEQVTPRVAEAIAIAGRTDDEVWRGARPTLPDSRPAIGPLPGDARLWANFGHHHVGLMTGPVTGKLVAQMLSDEPPDLDMRPFDPARVSHLRRPRDAGGWRGRRLAGGAGP